VGAMLSAQEAPTVSVALASAISTLGTVVSLDHSSMARLLSLITLTAVTIITAIGTAIGGCARITTSIDL
jgi:hypothetical protein